MKAERVVTANGIDDIKLIGETDLENLFIKQLAEAGTLSCTSRQVGDSIIFRPISVMPEMSTYSSSNSGIGKYNFEIRQNANHNVDLRFDKDTTPIDLTTFTEIKLQVKHSKSAHAIIELSIGSGLEISGDDLNILKVSFAATQTKLLTCESYYYDILMVTPTSNTYYLEGIITVKKTATR